MKTSFKILHEGKRIRDQTAYEKTPNWGMFDVELLEKRRRVKLRGEFPVPEFDDILPGMTFSGVLTEKPLRDGTNAMEAKEIRATNPRSVLVVQNMRRSSLHKLGNPLRKLHERFGEELYDALNRVAEGAASIGTLGLSKRSAEMHVAVFKERKACIDLATEVPEIPTVALGAMVHATLEKLRADPYCIADVKVRSVRSMLAVSDTIARRADIALSPSDPKRVRAYIRRACEELTSGCLDRPRLEGGWRSGDGGFWRRPENIVEAVGWLLRGDGGDGGSGRAWALPAEALEAAFATGKEHAYGLVRDGDGEHARYALKAHHDAEVRLAKSLAKVRKQSLAAHDNRTLRSALERMEEGVAAGAPSGEAETSEAMRAVMKAFARLDAAQRGIFRQLLVHRVACLCGGPGRGKSFVLGLLVRFFEACGVDVCACAPTGKAATRLNRCIGDGVVANTARTIDSLAHTKPDEGTAATGAYVVDEVSMCDLSKLQMLLDARGKRMNYLILCGDPDQLPSIGPGAVLRDLVESGAVATTRLCTVHRQAGGGREITEVAPRIVDGTLAQAARGVLGADGVSLAFLDTSPDATLRGAIDLAARHLAAGESVLFATPRNAARVQINREMQARLNPPGDPAKEIAPRQATATAAAADGTATTLPWRVGDVVMNLKNAHVGDAYLANGDVGRVLRIDKAERKVFARFGDAKIVHEYPADHPDLTHAWCVTAHKSQGDEADRVVFYMDGPILASREMLNTVVTRAKTGASLIMARPALAACLSKSVRDERCTRLAKRLREAFAGVAPESKPEPEEPEPAPAPAPAVPKRQKTSPYFA